VDETVELQEFQHWHKNAHHEGGEKGNDSEEEGDDEPRGQRVGC